MILRACRNLRGLLRQASSYESRMPLMNEEGFQAGDEAVLVQREDCPGFPLHLNAALCATTPRSYVDEDLVAVALALNRFKPRILDGIWLHPGPQRRSACDRELASYADELNIRVGELDCGIEVSAIERLIGSKNLLNVLLRHRPRIMSAQGAER